MATAEKNLTMTASLDFGMRARSTSLSLCLQPGYGDACKLFPRSPRLEFDEACRIA
jgi:hypothetical protein